MSKMTPHEVMTACIDKELEKYGVTAEDVRLNPSRKANGTDVEWYLFYTFDSEQEFEAWKKFCINLFRTGLKQYKKQAEVTFEWFNLKYGLKQNY